LVGLIPTLEHLGYYLLGYVIVVDGWGKKWWRMSGVVAVIGVVAVSVVTFRLTGFKGGFDEWFWDYVSVGIVVASVAGLVWLKGWVEKHGDGWNNGVVEGVERLSKLTLSIYFVHIWVLEVAREMFGVGELRFHPAVSIPVISGLVFGGSWVLVEIMRRVRGLGWWVV